MCISGHHRIKAAKKAGLHNVPALIINEVDESTRIRLQLAHNDIHGNPDKDIIAILQSKLNDLDFNLVDFIDAKIKEIEVFDIEKVKFKYLSVCLMPESLEELNDLLAEVGNSDEKYLIEKDDYYKMKELLTIAFKKGFKTPGKAFRKFLDIAKENI